VSGALDGRHAIVTGGAGAIGFAIAKQLVEHGARVTVTGRTAARLENAVAKLGGRRHARAEAADVADEQAVNAAFERAAAEFGPVGVLVNSAGIAESAPFAKTDTALWERHIATNLTGPFYCCKAVVPGMRRADFGRIVTVASVAGLRGAPYITAYCASKHGVIGLTRALALELASTGITVNAVCPGYVDTPMTDATIQNIVDKTGMSAGDARARLIESNPQGRLLRPEEVAGAVIGLCLPGSESVTGQSIVISGDEVTGLVSTLKRGRPSRITGHCGCGCGYWRARISSRAPCARACAGNSPRPCRASTSWRSSSAARTAFRWARSRGG
jgi:NAD(P)-dependent dehydrogenase (short-subunit alcohol dehydrogenase family)